MTTPCIILTSCGSEEKAEEISEYLVDHSMAACVTVITKAKTYVALHGRNRWDEEFQLLIYTTAELFGEVENVIKLRHTYEVPEISMVMIDQGSNEFVNWVQKMGRT
jgi:periplasmic divalent cation tolerance protein